VTKTVLEGARQLVDMGSAIQQVQREALRKSAGVAKDIANATGGHMRNIGKKGANLTATYTVSTTQASLKPKPAGAWKIAESGARAHLIGIAAKARRGSRATGFIYAGGYAHPVRGPVAHPGARGRLLWTRTVKAAERAVPPVFNQVMIAGTVKRFF
jgi:hypothetical protein